MIKLIEEVFLQIIGTSYLPKFKKELSQISRTTRRKMMKICEKPKGGQ